MLTGYQIPTNDYQPHSGHLISAFQIEDTDNPSRIKQDIYRSNSNAHFRKRKTNSPSSRFTKQVAPHYNKIRPIIDDLISEQIGQNKEIVRALKGLKSIQQQLSQGLNGNEQSNYDRVRRGAGGGTYWQQIERLIYQIINNSENQSAQFKASLQHLNNMKERALKQDLNYYEGERSNFNETRKHSKPQYRSQSRNHKVNSKRQLQPIYEQRQRGRSNQQILLEQIAILKKQKQELIQRLNQQIDKNRYLTHRINQLEQSYNYTHESDSQDLGYKLQQLHHRLQQVNYENDNLRHELKNLQRSKRIRTGSPQHSNQNIRQLEAYVQASQRRANAYQSMKHNQRNLQAQVHRLRSESGQIRNDFRFSRSPSGDLRRLREGLADQKQYLPRNVQSKYYRPEEREERDYDRYY